MTKFKSAVLILGMLVVIIAVSLLTFLALSVTGIIVTEKIQVSFRVDDKIKLYDGEPLVADSYALTQGELVEGHTAQVVFTGSQTEAGTGVSGMEVKIVDENEYDVTNEYSIRVEEGALIVGKASVLISLNDSEVMYNGETVMFDDYTVLSGSLAKGHRVGALKTAGIISVNEILTQNDVAPAIYDTDGRNVSDNYDINFKMGEVKITARPLVIRPVGAEKVYDGTPLTCSKYEIVAGSLASGQYATVTFTAVEGGSAQITNAGEMGVKSSVIIRDAKGNEVTSNYALNNSEIALLKVTKRELQLTAKSASWEYDGYTHSLNSDREPYSVYGLVEGQKVTVVYEDKITNAGSTPSNISSYTISGGASNYNVTCVPGTLTITPLKLTVSLQNLSKVYDGTPFNLDSDKEQELYSFSKNLPSGMKFTTNVNDVLSGFIDAGSATYNLTQYTIKLYNEDCSQNIEATVLPGSVIISQKILTVTLKTESFEKVYDGTPFTIDNENININGMADGQSISAYKNTEIIDVTEGRPCYITSLSIKDGKESDVSKNYIFNFDNAFASVRITPKQVNVSLNDKDKTYDGKPVVLSELTYSCNDINTDDLILKSSNIEGITEAGEYNYTAVFEVKVGNSNYDISVNSAKYKISPKSVTVTYNGPESKVYDGKKFEVDCNNLSVNEADISVSAITYDSIVTVKDSGSLNIEVLEFMMNGARVPASNFEVEITAPEITINPREFTMYLGTITLNKEDESQLGIYIYYYSQYINNFLVDGDTNDGCLSLSYSNGTLYVVKGTDGRIVNSFGEDVKDCYTVFNDSAIQVGNIVFI